MGFFILHFMGMIINKIKGLEELLKLMIFINGLFLEMIYQEMLYLAVLIVIIGILNGIKVVV